MWFRDRTDANKGGSSEMDFWPGLCTITTDCFPVSMTGDDIGGTVDGVFLFKALPSLQVPQGVRLSIPSDAPRWTRGARAKRPLTYYHQQTQYLQNPQSLLFIARGIFVTTTINQVRSR